ncbi:hypothetical protein Tco_1102753 [Tanacetum coccineum]
MDNELMWAADRVVAPTPSPAITIPKTAKEFTIKGNHLTLVKGNQFDGRYKTDPHKHIQEFLDVCDMFKYEETKNEVVRLMMFPLSLTGEAKTCMDVIDEFLEEDFDALLDEAMNIKENFKFDSNKEEIPFEKITIDTNYKINESLDETPTDLELKLLLGHLEYASLEEPYFLPVIISSQLTE